MITLRPYQAQGVAESRACVLAGQRRVIMCSPTGGGKTVLAASIIESARSNFDAKVLFVAHRLELIDQAVKQLARWGVTEVGVIRADDDRTNLLMPVQIASIQTLVRRKIAFVPTIVITDECHRACAESYMKYVFEAYPNAVHIGLTATPCRSDQKPLGRKSGGPYDVIVQAASYANLIADGFISAPRCFSVPERMKPDLSKVHTHMGDYDLEELETVMTGDALVGGIFERWQELHHIDGISRSTVIFATSVAHSQAIVKKFHEEGVHAAHIDGNTPEDLRAEILAKLNRGDIDVVSNCQILTEGWDQPSVKCVVLARPTKSMTLYKQMSGRGLRPCCECGHPPDVHDQKACTICGCLDMKLVTPIILDHGANLDRHGRPDDDVLWDIEGPPKRTSHGKFKVCPKCYAYIPSSARECEHCNHSFVVASIEPPKLPREFPGMTLVERGPVDEKRRFYDQMVRLARAKGYKWGFASAKYKEKFKDWPPKWWSDQTKVDFERDVIWQMNLARTERFRKMRAMTEAELAQAKGQELEDLAAEMFKEWDAK
jgi:superfamily II DNA or RNA helicase